MKKFIITEDDKKHIKGLYEQEAPVQQQPGPQQPGPQQPTPQQPGPTGPPTTDKPECKVGEKGTLVQIQNVIGLSDPSKGGLFCKLPITKLGAGGTQSAPVTPPQPAPAQPVNEEI
jgi:hypothetical protein